MPRSFMVTSAERQELTALRDHGTKAYLRERAAALLKVADGTPAARVARAGLVRPHTPDTVYAWIDRFIAAGSAGLQIQAGRGRKLSFSPLADDSGDSPR